MAERVGEHEKRLKEQRRTLHGKNANIEKVLAGGVKNREKQRQERREVGHHASTLLEKKARRMAEKADPHWEMADKPERTKGHRVFEEYNKNK